MAYSSFACFWWPKRSLRFSATRNCEVMLLEVTASFNVGFENLPVFKNSFVAVVFSRGHRDIEAFFVVQSVPHMLANIAKRLVVLNKGKHTRCIFLRFPLLQYVREAAILWESCRACRAGCHTHFHRGPAIQFPLKVKL